MLQWQNMFRIKPILLILLMITVCVAPWGDANARARRKQVVNKYADIVIEADTGYILRSRSSNDYRYPASLTKMMTLYLVFQALEKGQIRMDTQLRVSRLAARQPASKLGLKVGQRISVYDAIMSQITLSANDASVVLAEGVGGSLRRFVYMMNRQARALGMNRTRFKNPSGLPHRMQQTTARDMAVLSQALIYHYPGFYPYFSRDKHDYEGRTLRGHNKLQKTYRGMDGIKTGYTIASGFNLASSATRHGTRLIGVVFGGKKAASRDAQMKEILDKSFKRVQWKSVQRILKRGMPRYRHADYLKLAAKNDVIRMARRKATREAVKKVAHNVVKEVKQVRKLSKKKKNLALLKPRGKYIASPKSSTSNKSTWGLQIGAFSELQGAERILKETAQGSRDLLEDARQSLQKLTMTDGSTIYRARFLGIDQQTARAVCSHLVRKGQNCLVVSGL